MRRLHALRPHQRLHPTVQAIAPHQPRSVGILDDLREISRLTPGNQLPVVPDWQQQPSYLLDAQRQVVPFRPRSRDAELATLTAWRDDSSARVSLRLVHGPGGQGKTRLASRFASHAHAAGWMVAQAVDKHPGLRGRLNHELNLSSVSGMGLLVVVD